MWVPGLGVNWLDSVQISKGVENVFGLGLEGWRLEAKEQGVGVSWVQSLSMGVDGWIWSKIRYVGTSFGGKWVGFVRFVREGPKCL